MNTHSGNGTTINKNIAEVISALSIFNQFEAVAIPLFFFKNDGQLGNETSIARHSPVQVIDSWGDSKIICTEATREHSLFQDSNGEIWVAGRNNYGQLEYGIF